MIDNLFLSIIIPFFNKVDLLIDTVNSINTNFEKDFEIILIDDGSTKNSSEVIKKIINQNIKYYRIKNSERGFARNYGAQKARGVYLNFFDSDDLCLNNHVYSSKEFAKKNNYPEVFANSYSIIDNHKNKKKTIVYKKILNNLIFKSNILSCNSVLIKKEIFIKFKFCEKRELSGSEDWDLWLRLASRYKIFGNQEITSILYDHNLRSTKIQDNIKIISRLDILEYRVINSNIIDLKKYKNIILSEIYLFKSMILSFNNTEKFNSIKFFFKSFTLYKIRIFSLRTLVIIKNLFFK